MTPYVVEGGESRNTYPAGLSAGGREIYRRTGWSVPLCNLVAALAGLGSPVEG